MLIFKYVLTELMTILDFSLFCMLASFAFPYKLIYFLFLKGSDIVGFCVMFRVFCMMRRWQLGLASSSCQVE